MPSTCDGWVKHGLLGGMGLGDLEDVRRGNMRYKVTHDGTTKTYAALLHTAWHLLDLAKNSEEGALLNLQASAVFHAFSFEAYLNHVGANEIAFWEQIDRLSYKRKLRIIETQLGLSVDHGKPPFQIVIELFSLRNALAHGRTMEIDVSYEIDTEPARRSAWRIHEWERLSVDTVDRYRTNVRAAVETINQARSRPDDDHELWSQGIRGRTVQAVE